jgi:ATP-binding cassette subfamily B protein
MHGGGGGGSTWHLSMHAAEAKPKITRALLVRVLRYARPYWRHLLVMLVMILLSTVVGLISPLIFRTMIDKVLPSRDLTRLAILALALLFLPILDGGISVVQRRLNAQVGEGVIYDLRNTLYTKLQQMSLRFFTNTRVGEMMSRLNNDVVGAQNAVSSTFVNIITNLIQGSCSRWNGN